MDLHTFMHKKLLLLSNGKERKAHPVIYHKSDNKRESKDVARKLIAPYRRKNVKVLSLPIFIMSMHTHIYMHIRRDEK